MGKPPRISKLTPNQLHSVKKDPEYIHPSQPPSCGGAKTIMSQNHIVLLWFLVRDGVEAKAAA